MANITATKYNDLKELLGNRNEQTIGNNTKATQDTDSDVIVITLHGNPIVALWPDDTVDITLAGYPTVTTRERINQFLPPHLKVVQRNKQQKLALTIDGETHYRLLSSFQWQTVYTRDHGVEHAFVVNAN